METSTDAYAAWFAAVWTVVQEIRHLILRWRKEVKK